MPNLDGRELRESGQYSGSKPIEVQSETVSKKNAKQVVNELLEKAGITNEAIRQAMESRGSADIFTALNRLTTNTQQVQPPQVQVPPVETAIPTSIPTGILTPEQIELLQKIAAQQKVEPARQQVPNNPPPKTDFMTPGPRRRVEAPPPAAPPKQAIHNSLRKFFKG